MADNSNQTNIVSFAPGEFVIREKTSSDALYIIKEGQLEVYKTGTNGGWVDEGLAGRVKAVEDKFKKD